MKAKINLDCFNVLLAVIIFISLIMISMIIYGINYAHNIEYKITTNYSTHENLKWLRGDVYKTKDGRKIDFYNAEYVVEEMNEDL